MIIEGTISGLSDRKCPGHSQKLSARQRSVRVDQAAIIVLNIRDCRTVLLLPAYSEEAVAEWYDVNIDDLGPSEWPFLDLELQLRN